MYTSYNFKSKKAVKEAIAQGKKITVFQPNADLTGAQVPLNGVVGLEGPHYPEAHKWYGEGTLKDGYLVNIK